MRRLGVIGVLGLLLFTSCKSVTSPEDPCQLQGEWQLVELSNGTSVAIPNPEQYTIRFEADGQVNIEADCNGCFGSYETDGNALTMGPLGCTAAYCGPLSFFDAYTAALTNVSSWSCSANELELTHSGGTLKFRKSGASG